MAQMKAFIIPMKNLALFVITFPMSTGNLCYELEEVFCKNRTRASFVIQFPIVIHAKKSRIILIVIPDSHERKSKFLFIVVWH